jgi:8-oxo-dGTP diphosphatase
MPHIEIISRALVLRGGRILLCRSIAGDYYYLPGGHVEFGEPAATALARELNEEAGLQVRPGPCALVTEACFESAGGEHHELNLVFHVELAETVGEVQSREGAIAFNWIDLAAAPDLDIRPPAIKSWLASGGRSEAFFVSGVFHVAHPPRQAPPMAQPPA